METQSWGENSETILKRTLKGVLEIPEDGVYRMSKEDAEKMLYKGKKRIPDYSKGYDKAEFIEVPSNPRSKDEVAVEIGNKALSCCLQGNWKEAMKLAFLRGGYKSVVVDGVDPYHYDAHMARAGSMEADLRSNIDFLVMNIATAVAMEDESTSKEDKDVLLSALKKQINERGAHENPDETRRWMEAGGNMILIGLLNKSDEFLLELAEKGELTRDPKYLVPAERRGDYRKEIMEASAGRVKEDELAQDARFKQIEKDIRDKKIDSIKRWLKGLVGKG